MNYLKVPPKPLDLRTESGEWMSKPQMDEVLDNCDYPLYLVSQSDFVTRRCYEKFLEVYGASILETLTERAKSI